MYGNLSKWTEQNYGKFTHDFLCPRQFLTALIKLVAVMIFRIESHYFSQRRLTLDL